MAPWPPQGTEARPWQYSDKVQGMDVYIVSDADNNKTWGVVRMSDASEPLQGKQAFDAARNKVGDDDPVLLATLAMLFLDRGVAGHEPWVAVTAPQRVPEQQAIATPPSVSGDTLEYWRFHAQLADMVRCRVTLSTGAVACELGNKLLRDDAMAENPMETIEKDLGADDIYTRMRGIDSLVGLNTDAAHKRLQDLALNQGHFKVREAAVKALGKTGGHGTVATLSRVLLHDGHQKVRLAAASALGKLADPDAREALQKAAHGDGNDLVRGEARRALVNLP